MTNVPAPVFNPPVSEAPFTHYVDNSHPNATDLNNPNGSLLKPRVSIPLDLSAGSIVEVRGFLYPIGSAQGTIQFNGTIEQPIFIRAIGNPTVLGSYGARLTITGQYGVWSGLSFNNVAVNVIATNFVFTNNEVLNHESYGNSSALALSGSLITTSKCHIHHNGNPENPTEIDIHGILVSPGAKGIWILDNHIHHNGGDSIQVGQAQSPEPWTQGVFIKNNVMHEDRENAVDVKKSRDVIVLGNTIYGYKERGSSSGEGIVTHDGAERVWIVNNIVVQTVRGIVCTNAKSYIVIGNIIANIRHNPNNTYDPNSLYGSHAIITRDSFNIYHLYNSIWDCDGGISLASGNAGDRIVINNLIKSNVRPVAGTVTQNENNFIVLPTNDPMVDENLVPLPGSPLIGKGTYSTVFAAYQFLYGVSITETIGNVVRSNIGAL